MSVPPFAKVGTALKSFESTSDLAQFLTAFEIAIDHGVAREQFHPLIKNYITTTMPTLEDVQKALRWAERVEFRKQEPVVASPKPTYSPEFQELRDEVRRIGAAIGRSDQEAEDHLYWFFRPAWQVKSASWRELFGENDPAITIARYAKHSFKSTSEFRRPLVLGDADVLIITDLVDHLAICIRDCKTLAPEHARPVLAAAMGTEHLFPDRLLNHNFPFKTVFKSAGSFEGLPDWIAQYVLRYWARSLNDYGNDLSRIDESTKSSIVEQAQLVGAVLLTYVADDNEVGANRVPKLDYISDRSFTEVLHTIDWLNTELDILDLRQLLNSVIQATDRARVHRFGGQLPFSIHDASSLYQQADLETWISQIASYTSDRYEDELDRYAFSLQQNGDWGVSEEKRGNRPALQRYWDYRRALEEFTRDGLEELACAWWSFFIASQVLAFRNPAVPPDALQEMLQTASRFKSEPSMMKAVRYAAASIPKDTHNVVDMAATALLRNFIRHAEAESSNDTILQLGRSPEQVREFLKMEIGQETWDSLSEYSQNDLTEVEQLWGLSHFEFGTKKREDWGALISISARPIEAEMRDQLKDLFDRIENESGFDIKQRTLGGCLSAIRRAKKSEISPALSSCVKNIATFIDKHSFIERYRNLADHAERGKPLSAQELLKWRMMILKDGIFDVIVRTARDFRASAQEDHSLATD
jgi:hypothetical protein